MFHIGQDLWGRLTFDVCQDIAQGVLKNSVVGTWVWMPSASRRLMALGLVLITPASHLTRRSIIVVGSTEYSPIVYQSD